MRHGGSAAAGLVATPKCRSTTKKKQQTSGEALVESILADMAEGDLEPDAREAELLARASAAADKIAKLEAAVERSGWTYVDKDGVTALGVCFALRQGNSRAAK